jgi:hypothetical protein
MLEIDGSVFVFNSESGQQEVDILLEILKQSKIKIINQKPAKIHEISPDNFEFDDLVKSTYDYTELYDFLYFKHFLEANDKINAIIMFGLNHNHKTQIYDLCITHNVKIIVFLDNDNDIHAYLQSDYLQSILGYIFVPTQIAANAIGDINDKVNCSWPIVSISQIKRMSIEPDLKKCYIATKGSTQTFAALSIGITSNEFNKIVICPTKISPAKFENTIKIISETKNKNIKFTNKTNYSEYGFFVQLFAENTINRSMINAVLSGCYPIVPANDINTELMCNSKNETLYTFEDVADIINISKKIIDLRPVNNLVELWSENTYSIVGAVEGILRR